MTASTPRHHRPPLLTGGGERGVVGTPELTEAGATVLTERMARAIAALVYELDRAEVVQRRGTLATFDAIWAEYRRPPE